MVTLRPCKTSYRRYSGKHTQGGLNGQDLYKNAFEGHEILLLEGIPISNSEVTRPRPVLHAFEGHKRYLVFEGISVLPALLRTLTLLSKDHKAI